MLSNAVLKNIAYFSMLIDHFFAVVFWEMIQRYSMAGYETDRLRGIYSAGRAIGRIAFILFAYLAVEGFCYTRNRKKYLLRLGSFAFLSEIPFDLAFSRKVFDWKSQNVYFTLFLGVLVLVMWEWVSKRVCLLKRQNVRRNTACIRRDICYWMRIAGLRCVQLIFVISGCVAAYCMRTDYKYMGVLLIFAFYLLHGKSVLVQILPVGLVMLLGTWSVNCLRYAGSYSVEYLFRFSLQELYGLFAFIPIALYNGHKGRQFPKAVCYGFYPVHLLVLRGIAEVLAGM